MNWRGKPIVLTSMPWRLDFATTASGGAMNIVVLLFWALAQVAATTAPTARYGTSCGALVAAMMATRQLDLLLDLVAATVTRSAILGIPGVSRLAPWGGGLYSLEPLRQQLEEHWDPADLVEPLIVGVCERGGLYHDVVIGPDTPKADAIAAILASCAIAPIFHPVRWRGKLWGDGGHVAMVPVPYGASWVGVGCTRPLNDPEAEAHEDSLWGALLWMLDAAAVSGLRTSLAALHLQAERGVVVDLWAPTHRVSGRLSNDAQTYAEREEAGKAMVDAGPVRLGRAA